MKNYLEYLKEQTEIQAKELEEACKKEKELEEEKGDKEEYQKFFNKTLKKYNVDEPDQLSDEDKKKFYDEIDAGWKADNEKE